jgi:hypothetical protein
MDTLLIYKGSQSLEGSLTDYAGTVPVRAGVKRDAHDKQSFGVAQVWTDNGWSDVQRFPIHMFEVSAKSYVARDGEWEHLIEADLRELVSYARKHLAGGES